MRFKQLTQALADKTKERQAAYDEARAFAKKFDGKTAMTDEERAQKKTLLAKVDALDAELEVLAEDLKDEKRLQDLERRSRPVPDAAAAATEASETAARIEVGRNHQLDDPKKGFKSHQEFLRKVMDSARFGRTDARLEPLRVNATVGSDEQSGNEGQFGAFLIPMGFSPTLLQVTPEDDPTATLTTPIPMSNPIVNIPARTDKDHTTSVSGGLIVTRKRETVLATSARMSLEGVALHANSAFGLSYATEELLTDSPMSFVAILSAGFRDQFTSFLFNERLNGLGGGEPLGVMNSPCLVSIAKQAGQAAKTIVTENIDNMVAACWKYSKAIWLANHDTFPQIQGLTRAVGTGGSIVNYLQFVADSSQGANTYGMGQAMLLGRPCFFSEYPQALGTSGDIVLGVWSEYLHGTYQPLESAESIHVRFETHERTFKFWLRDDGQPWWKSPLTPKRGANKLSPFVVLAAR